MLERHGRKSKPSMARATAEDRAAALGGVMVGWLSFHGVSEKVARGD